MVKQRYQVILPVILLLLSLAGAGIALYLTVVHYEHVPLMCSAHGLVDCQRVTSSAYSVVPGTALPITIPGLGWAVGSAFLSVLEWRVPAHGRRLVLLHWLWSLLALLVALYLVYAEIVVLHTICVWCTGLHGIILCLFLLTLVRLSSSAEEENDEQKREEAAKVTTFPKW